ncbi:hypothetical protein CBL_09430 [Carabus blaptoides fortunei]
MDYAFIEEIYDEDSLRNKKEFKPNLVDIIIWIFGSICCGITSNVNRDGLKKNKPIYIVPWLVVSFWNMLACQYFSFEEIASGIFYAVLDHPVLGSILLLAGITSLAFRIYLWIKVFELTYCSKYEPETKFVDENYDKNSELDEFESDYIRDILNENNEPSDEQINSEEFDISDVELIETI